LFVVKFDDISFNDASPYSKYCRIPKNKENIEKLQVIIGILSLLGVDSKYRI